jgi:virginiamycin B lyase
MHTTRKIGYITQGGKMNEFLLPVANSNPWMITGGPDGTLWFAETIQNVPSTIQSEIGRITPTGIMTICSIPSVQTHYEGGGGSLSGISCGPISITTGSDGTLWFPDSNSYNIRIGHIATAKERKGSSLSHNFYL